jgi:peptidoglycan/LPS O-acetylase OafA/YrhL
MNRARISGYVPELDGLRAFAAIAVVVFHAGRNAVLPGGCLGVDIFFVLSAFLITALLDNELRRTGKIDLPRFYLNRFFRLVPALLLMPAVYVNVAPRFWPNHNHLADAFLSAAYLSDYSYAYSHSPFYLRHTWSRRNTER